MLKSTKKLATLILLFAFVCAGLLLAEIAKKILNPSSTTIAVDLRIANLFTVFRENGLTKAFFWITVLGKWQVVLVFALSVMCLLWIWRRRQYIVPFIITIIGSEAFANFGKLIFHRPRPATALYLEDSFSFPSGHATISVAFYGFIVYLFIRTFKKWRVKIPVFFICLSIILFVGLSRLYLGVHYISDIWAGYLVGALWLIIGIIVSEWLETKIKKQDRLTLPNKARLASIILIIAPILFYVGFAKNYNPKLLAPTSTTNKAALQDIRQIFLNDQLKYTETPTAKRQEPISFIIIAQDDQQLINIFHKAGWFLADKPSLSSITKLAKAALLKKPYPQAPMTPSFWNSKVHNLGFEKSTNNNNARERHHARFWDTGFTTKNSKNIYVGTASFDSNIKWLITHKIHPNIDAEREFIYKDLSKTGLIAESEKQSLVDPILGKNFAGDAFFTDGRAYIIFLL